MNDPIRLRTNPATAPGLRAALAVARPTPSISAGAMARTRPQLRRTRSLWVAAAAGVLTAFGWKPFALAAGILTASATYFALRPSEPATMTPPLPPSAMTNSIAVPPVASAIATAIPIAESVETPPEPASPIVAAPRPYAPPRRRASSVEEPAPSAVMPAPSHVGRLEEEVRLLGEGRNALHADPSRALAAAESHAQRYPNGQLRLERELLAIDALERLGRRDAARARAQAALLTARGSIYEARLQAHE